MITTEGGRNRGSDEGRIFLERLGQIAKRGAKDDRFRVLGEIAQGGMGRVLRVFDEDLRRELAMKVIRLGDLELGASSASTDTRENLALFLEEVQITGQLNHPSVVAVHDIGVNTRGELYYLMPLLRGVDLKAGIERLRRGEAGWTLPRVIEVICRAAQAVEHAHQSGVVHRDLKPANVMIGDLGEIWVLDWGLAQLERRPFDDGGGGVDSETHLLLRTGGIVGTPGYMAPEQVEGLAGTIGPRSDVYALGAVLYHVLSGEMPYASPPPSCAADTIVQRTLQGPPRRVHELAPQAQPELVAICEKAMRRNPAERYASALEMANDLRAWLEGRVVSTYDVGLVGTFRKWRRRNQAAARALDALAGVAVVGSLAFAIQQRRHVIAVERANIEEMRANHAANLRAAELSIQDRDAAEAHRLLALCPKTMRGWEWRWLQSRADASLAVLAAPGVTFIGMTLDAAGRSVASWDATGAVWLWDLERRTGRALDVRRSDGARRRLPVALSPDGRALAALVADARIEVIDLERGGEARAIEVADHKCTALAWSPDGRSLACGTALGGALMIDFATGRTLPTMLEGSPSEAIGVRHVGFAPDGAHVVVCGESRPPQVWHWRSDAASASETLGTEPAYAASFSPDGARIVVAGASGGIGIHATLGGEELARMDSGTREVYSAAFTSDGNRLLAAALDKSLQLWTVGAPAPAAVMLGHTMTVHALARVGAGDEFLTCSGDGTLRLWRPLEPPRGFERAPAPQLVALGRSAIDDELYGVATDGRIALLRPQHVELRGEPLANGLGLRAAIDADDAVALLGTTAGALQLRLLSDGSVQHEYAGISPRLSAVALDDGGQCVAAGSNDGTLTVLERASGVELLRDNRTDARVSALAFEPALHAAPRLAVGRERAGLWIVEPFAGGSVRVIDLDTREVSAIAWSGDGSTLVAGGIDGKIFLVDPAGADAPVELVGHARSVRAVWLARDGTRLYSVARDRELRIWDPHYKAPLLVLSGLDVTPTAMSVDADGETIACAGHGLDEQSSSCVLRWFAPTGGVNPEDANE